MQRVSSLTTMTMTLRPRTGRRWGTPTGPPSTTMPVQLSAACPTVAQGEGEREDEFDGEDEIEDDEAEIPKGWLESEPVLVPDPEATIPDDWDVEEDGAWEAPEVPNPKCESAPGCGPWSPPLIDNPKFKGKWFASGDRAGNVVAAATRIVRGDGSRRRRGCHVFEGAGRGGAAGATWIVRGDGSRRRRGCLAESPEGRVAAPPRVPRGSSGGDASRPRTAAPRRAPPRRPKIDNPAYKGVWKPRKIDNPEYFVPENPAKSLKPIGAVAVEIWTTNAGITYDSFYVGGSLDDAKAAAESYYEKKAAEQAAAEVKKAEKAARKAAKQTGLRGVLKKVEGYAIQALEQGKAQPLAAAGTLLAVLVTLLMLCKKKAPASEDEDEDDDDEEEDEEEEEGEPEPPKRRTRTPKAD